MNILTSGEGGGAGCVLDSEGMAGICGDWLVAPCVQGAALRCVHLMLLCPLLSCTVCIDFVVFVVCLVVCVIACLLFLVCVVVVVVVCVCVLLLPLLSLSVFPFLFLSSFFC